MAQFEGLIRRVVQALREADLDYMFTGALAASYYGLPRTTTDVDIVVRVTEDNIPTLTRHIKKAGLKGSSRKIQRAIQSGYKIVNIQDKETPLTVDVILSTQELNREKGTILGLPTWYQTPEALILSKLRRIQATRPKERSVKDKQDIRAILRYTEVDMDNLKKQAKKITP
ncbi:MAG: hypothetical protein ACOC6H_01070 [Thermoproteota archaeon]